MARVLLEGLGVVARLDLVDGHLGLAIFFEFYDYGGAFALKWDEGNVGKALACGEFGKYHVVSVGIKVGHKDGALHAGLEIVG